MSTTKTWSIVADRMGGHWHTVVRRGVEGSRAKLGELMFDLSDAEDVRDRIEYVTTRVVIRATSGLIERMCKDLHLPAPNPALITLYNQEIAAECCQLALEQFQHTFGVRVDLAKVNG